jgi:hypothetical protein
VIARPGTESVEVREAQRYLARYGYMSDEERSAVEDGRLTVATEAALRRFQRFRPASCHGHVDRRDAQAHAPAALPGARLHT